jgi:putative transposase
LKREVGTINHKRVQRLYRLEGLAIRRRARKRVAREKQGLPTPTWRPGQSWAMDSMQDMLADGRRFRTLNVLDTITGECLAIEVDTSLPGGRVVQVLNQLVAWHGVPKRITLDNGPSSPGSSSTPGRTSTASRKISSIRASPCKTGTWRASTASSATNA